MASYAKLKKEIMTDYTGQVIVYQGSADWVGFDGSSTTLIQSKNSVHEALVELDRILNKKMEANVYTANASATYNGAAAPFTQDVSVTGMKASDTIAFVDVVTSTSNSNDANNQIKNFGYITKVIPGDNKITLRCDKKKPTITLPLQIIVFRKAF